MIITRTKKRRISSLAADRCSTLGRDTKRITSLAAVECRISLEITLILLL